MIKRVLIANRGEIACRVIASAKKMAIETVAVYSDADRTSQHVIQADYAEYIGPSPASESYLVIDKIIQAAKKWQADAIHPGYGFLSENSEMAKACEANNIRFIGPPADAIDKMGSKSQAKAIMASAQVPLVPGYHGKDNSKETLIAEADKIGYPVMLKATLGGGGKGMRVVNSHSEMPAAIDGAQREALSSFGNSEMLIEKCIIKPRHVEVQVFADTQGNCLYLSDRDCSIQRRHQKVVEEAPAPGLTNQLRQQMGEAAVLAAKAINYVGAGTVEFLLDSSGHFYFMEMNTRLQVEHPVTEMITGIDLVDWQFRVASGEPLPITQQQISHNGHAIELRIYAEDTDNGFMPSTGKITRMQEPKVDSYVRLDSGVTEGDVISEYYDPMISKLIVWGEDRNIANSRLKKALSEYHIQGVTTNIGYMHSIISLSAFTETKLDTDFLITHEQAIEQQHHVDDAVWLMMAAAARWQKLNEQTDSELASPNRQGFRLSPVNLFRFNFSDQHNHQLILRSETSQGNDGFSVAISDLSEEHSVHSLSVLNSDKVMLIEADGKRHKFMADSDEQSTAVFYQGQQRSYQHHANCESEDSASDELHPTAPLNGIVSAILVNKGDKVKAGDPLLVMEAMKMEYTITSSQHALVDEVLFQLGDQVQHGSVLVNLSPCDQLSASEVEA